MGLDNVHTSTYVHIHTSRVQDEKIQWCEMAVFVKTGWVVVLVNSQSNEKPRLVLYRH